MSGPATFAAQPAGTEIGRAYAPRFMALGHVVFALASLLVFAFVVTTPMNLGQQTVFAVLCFGAALALNRIETRLSVLALVVLSVAASTRYMYWRVTQTLGFDTWLDQLFGYGLVLAELYAFVVLLLGYFQTAWPLNRQAVTLPPDAASWPTVDVFIPTYNEPLEVVRQTVFTTMGLDWPGKKLKIYVLDDGRRPEFRSFCVEAGVGYVTRADNRHAKAGNINAALAQTNSEYVAIFDCDHIPTRSFLQVTMGWFLKDPKLAMLQTPHVFFSPDPFEKNLETFHRIPNEGELFYGLIQDGNDLWNATFFCGSCAVMRRSALMEVGGIAVETVTEDAHTALKLSRKGYNTAYLALPQAAGLATENLSGHIGQRIRWARGMAQIARLDNPLFGPGLRMGQRLCYLNAMLHFFYGLPRIVFMTAPLAYLFFGAHVFQATGYVIASFALPHLFHAMLTNSRVQGKFRHSFWNEVYESVLAWYITRPVLLAFVNPRLGKFNVTAKGGVNQHTHFDWSTATPYVVLLILNCAGLGAGVYQMWGASNSIMSTIVINMAWTLYNVMIAAASVAVANETRQVRQAPRVDAGIPASLTLPDGRVLVCRTGDFSQSGIGLQVAEDVSVRLGEKVHVGIFMRDEEGVFPATVAFRKGNRLGLHFDGLNMEQHVELAQLTFGRADNWLSGDAAMQRDAPLASLGRVARVGLQGLGMLLSQVSRHKAAASPILSADRTNTTTP